MTIIWLIYGIRDEFRPMEKQQLVGDNSAGYAIAIIPCMIIDVIICALFFKLFDIS